MRLQPSAPGFALTEWLIATAITLLLAGALLSIVGPGTMAFRAQPAFTDMRQRLRFASEVLAERVAAAGNAPPGGVSGLPLGSLTPCLLPYRVGSRRADPPATFRIDALTVIAGRSTAATAFLGAPLLAGQAIAVIDAARCSPASPACGLTAGTNVLLLPGGGESRLFRVTAVEANLATLVAASPLPSRDYAAGTPVVPVEIAVFYLADAEDGSRQLMRYDGWESDLPVLDHVAGFEVEWFGATDPPRMHEVDGSGERPTYGPPPPPPLVDLPDDGWGPGENCVFARVGDDAVPRLPALPGSPVAVAGLGGAALTDGPWCGASASPTARDADLFRVRRLRLTLRVEAQADSSRGPDERFFARPWAGRNPHVLAPDQSVTWDLAARSLGGW